MLLHFLLSAAIVITDVSDSLIFNASPASPSGGLEASASIILSRSESQSVCLVWWSRRETTQHPQMFQASHTGCGEQTAADDEHKICSESTKIIIHIEILDIEIEVM